MGIRCRACEGLRSGWEGFLQGTVAAKAALGARPFEGKARILRMFLQVSVCVFFPSWIGGTSLSTQKGRSRQSMGGRLNKTTQQNKYVLTSSPWREDSMT